MRESSDIGIMGSGERVGAENADDPTHGQITPQPSHRPLLHQTLVN